MTTDNAKPVVDMVADVFDFNERVIKIPKTVELNGLSRASFEWTMKAFKEEIQEFSDAREAWVDGQVDFPEAVVDMVDACLDEVYFQFGTLKKMGLTVDQVYTCFTVIHTANMTKKLGATHRGSEVDAAKPPEFVDPKTAIRKILFGD